MEEDLEVFQEQALSKASPCEAELQELVHQIDIMVNRKQVEWERKMRVLGEKMDIQDQELASAQSKLDQKCQEVGMLQQKLEDLEKTKYEMAQSYETQLQALKSQFSKLTHSYEKLQSHKLNQKQVESREKHEESLETPSDPRNLYKKLEEFKGKSGEWDKNGAICKNCPVCPDARQKLWPEKCNLFQRQIQNYQFQICNEKQNQEEVITYAQPESEKDELIIEKLKVTVNEIARNKNKLKEENLKLREDLKMYQTQCQIRDHVYREEQSHRSEQERMKTEISDLTEELHQKEITIATIMEKASLLERQLKMELEIKDKLLAKQQLLEFRYKVIKSENTHLKEMVENQESESCTSTDLCNKEHGNFTASGHKMKHENLRLQNSLVKLQNDTETLTLGCMEAYGEIEHSYQTHSKIQEKEERTSRNEDAWEMECQQTAVFTASGYHRNCSPALYGQGNIIGSKSDSTLSSHPLHRAHEKKRVYKYPSPPVEYSLGFGVPFPEMGGTGSSLSPAYSAEEIELSSPPEISLLATTEKFLQEEEKHTREFEERLNSHLEELQRYSENTLKKYARVQQSSYA